MILIQNLVLRYPHTAEDIKRKTAECLGIAPGEIRSMEILRRSLDARKKPVLCYVYSLEVDVPKESAVLHRVMRKKKGPEQIGVSARVEYVFPNPKNREPVQRPIVIGAGPAGLFCTCYLAHAGLNPILLEQGKRVEERREDVLRFWETGCLDPLSNVQFGEGGAGTFSDGKLNTMVKDTMGRNRAVLKTFVKYGAKDCILYDAKPHIGTDELFQIIRNMREDLLHMGAEIRFEAKVTDLLTEPCEDESGRAQILGVKLRNGETVKGSQVVLAIGHSARDTFEMLYQKNALMEPKPFAVGFRVEHPQEMIDSCQYGEGAPKELGAASYKVTAKAENGRSVFSFCMCPGGYVVNASSEPGRLAVNGMSYSGRSGKNANSAVIVSVTPEDYPGSGPLRGIQFQRELEEKAYELGHGKVPVQRYGAFQRKVLANGQESDCPSAEEAQGDTLLMPECKGGYAWADLSSLLPRPCSLAFLDGMKSFGRQIRGFDREDAVLSGVESRTSSPVRIVRDELLQSNIRGLYPCGEGAGYAGGITSAAMDGLRVAEEVLKRIDES